MIRVLSKRIPKSVNRESIRFWFIFNSVILIDVSGKQQPNYSLADSGMCLYFNQVMSRYLVNNFIMYIAWCRKLCLQTSTRRMKFRWPIFSYSILIALTTRALLFAIIRVVYAFNSIGTWHWINLYRYIIYMRDWVCLYKYMRYKTVWL